MTTSYCYHANHVLLTRVDSIHVTQGPDNGTYSVRAHNNGEAILNVSISTLVFSLLRPAGGRGEDLYMY